MKYAHAMKFEPDNGICSFGRLRRMSAVQLFFFLLVLTGIPVIILIYELFTHPAWTTRNITARLPRRLVPRSALPEDLQGGPESNTPFKIDPPANKTVPWLPDFRKADSGTETITLDNGDKRTVKWRVISKQKPRALIVENTITAEEAAAIVASAKKDLARSEVIAGNKGEHEAQEIRTSMGMFMISPEQAELPANKNVRRVCGAIGGLQLPADAQWIEATQVLHYKPQQRYVPHPDYYSAGDSANLERGGQRIFTCLTWLNDVEAGGETEFPNAGVVAKPHKLNTIVFYSVDRDMTVDPFSIHAGEPPRAGSEKWVAVQWVHGRPFY